VVEYLYHNSSLRDVENCLYPKLVSTVKLITETATEIVFA